LNVARQLSVGFSGRHVCPTLLYTQFMATNLLTTIRDSSSSSCYINCVSINNASHKQERVRQDLPGGPVGPPAGWAATSNVEGGRRTEDGAQGPLAREGGCSLHKLFAAAPASLVTPLPN